MLPLAAEIRRGKIYTLTDAGRDAARQLLLDSSPEDPVAQVLRALEHRPLSAAYLVKIAARRQGDPLARAQGLHRFRAGADRARSAARALRPAARGTGGEARPAELKMTKVERELPRSWNCIRARTI